MIYYDKMAVKIQNGNLFHENSCNFVINLASVHTVNESLTPRYIPLIFFCPHVNENKYNVKRVTEKYISFVGEPSSQYIDYISHFNGSA